MRSPGRAAAVILVVGALTGCGSSSSSSPRSNTVPTPRFQPGLPATTRFRDASYKFAFVHPTSWHVLPGRRNVGGVERSYVLPVAVPGSRTRLQVRVLPGSTRIGNIADGSTKKRGGTTLKYHRLRVDGRLAMEIDQMVSGGVRQVDTVVNGSRSSYDIRISAAATPIPPRELVSYSSIVRTFAIGNGR